MNKLTKTIAIVLAALFVTAALPLYAAENAPVAGFADVKEGKWYAAAVSYVAENELMTGTTATTFEPSTKLTRAMSVLILAKIAKADLASYTATKFTDVPAGKWYTAAVAWADENGVANGTGELFLPGDSVTREQLAQMIYKFAEKYDIYNEYPTMTENADGFTDADKIHSWAKEGVDWAVNNGMISGMGDGSLDPRGTATRAQAAQIFNNLHYMNEKSYLPPDTTDYDAVTIKQEDDPRVVIWGNSMSQGYDDDLAELLPDGILCRSFASGGDTAQHIAMKQGGIPFYVAPFTIPAEKEAVRIEILDENLQPVVSLSDWDTTGLSPATIAGVNGFISNNGNDEYFFKRNDNGPYEEINIDRLTRIVTRGMVDLRTGDIHVIYAGAYSMTPDQYVDLINNMIEFSESEKYVIIGFTAPDSGELYDTIVENFGNNYLDIKTYFMTQALADAGIEPTPEDLEDISNGKLPLSLRSDDVHGNAIYDALLAKLVYNKIVELGYLA